MLQLYAAALNLQGKGSAQQQETQLAIISGRVVELTSWFTTNQINPNQVPPAVPAPVFVPQAQPQGRYVIQQGPVNVGRDLIIGAGGDMGRGFMPPGFNAQLQAPQQVQPTGPAATPFPWNQVQAYADEKDADFGNNFVVAEGHLKDVTIGGNLVIQTGELRDVSVGGNLFIEGAVSLKDCTVGGTIYLVRGQERLLNKRDTDTGGGQQSLSPDQWAQQARRVARV